MNIPTQLTGDPDADLEAFKRLKAEAERERDPEEEDDEDEGYPLLQRT